MVAFRIHKKLAGDNRRLIPKLRIKIECILSLRFSPTLNNFQFACFARLIWLSDACENLVQARALLLVAGRF